MPRVMICDLCYHGEIRKDCDIYCDAVNSIIGFDPSFKFCAYYVPERIYLQLFREHGKDTAKEMIRTRFGLEEINND